MMEVGGNGMGSKNFHTLVNCQLHATLHLKKVPQNSLNTMLG
jgi:hypothetical protein